MRVIVVKDTSPDPNSLMAYKSANVEHYLLDPLFAPSPIISYLHATNARFSSKNSDFINKLRKRKN